MLSAPPKAGFIRMDDISRFHLSMEVRDALPVASIVGASAGPAIAARRINAALQAYFMEELRVASPSDRAGMGSGS